MHLFLPARFRPGASTDLDAAIAANVAAHQGTAKEANGLKAEAAGEHESARAMLGEIRARVDRQGAEDPTIRMITEGLQAMGKEL